jgi:hypothetical protein
MVKLSIYRNITDINSKFTVELGEALERIKKGKSRELIAKIRLEKDSEIRNAIKAKLPSITFSGTFEARYDDQLIEHSGFICLDFDKVGDVSFAKEEFKKDEYCYACWKSPSGDGVKVLYKIAEGMKHREHFASIKKKYPNVDGSGVNPSRVCYESHDTDIFINEKAKVWTEYIEEVKFTQTTVEGDKYEVFKRLLKWLESRDNAFVKGERNLYIFRLASACCRFGIEYNEAEGLIANEFLTKDSDFSKKECFKTIASAYKKNQHQFNSAGFENEKMVTIESRYTIDEKILEDGYKLPDVIYGSDVEEGVYNVYENGFESAETTHITKLDEFFKWKKGQLNLFSGIGNAGKSTLFEYLAVVKAIKAGWKTAFFSPENYPSDEWFFQLTEIWLGADCSPYNRLRPNVNQFKEAFEEIKKHFFYVYPEKLSPTPDYIKSKFFELIIKEKVDIVCLDPFNQLTNDYNKHNGRDDRYLETVLGDFGKFAKENHISFNIIAHPHKMQLGTDGNYPCPNVFDLSQGAMWNNKMDNIFIYHRPLAVTEPMSPIAEFHSKKVKKQRLFKKGMLALDYNINTRRFLFDGVDPLIVQKPIVINEDSQDKPF